MFRYSQAIEILMIYITIISTMLFLHVSLNFILFNGIYIRRYVLKSSAVKVIRIDMIIIVIFFRTKSYLECKQYLGLPPYGRIRASTTWPVRRQSFCQPDDAYLMSNKGWCSKKKYRWFNVACRVITKRICLYILEYGQWLEFDLGHPSMVTCLITKGRADAHQDQWVTQYRVSFSNDTRLWMYYKDKSLFEPKVCVIRHEYTIER
jgi:hypothetical protein